MHILQVITAWLILIVISHNGTHSFGCNKTGNLQSPVAIFTSKVVPLPIPALKMIGYNDSLPMPQTLMNNGETVKLSMDENATNKSLPYVSGATLKQRHKIEQVHMHWGLENDRGSEHVLNGKRYPMETHIVHYNTKYSDFLQALEHEDGVAVVATFMQLQPEDNECLQPFINELPTVKWANTKQLVNTPMTLASLIPSNTDIFYTYKGSLTTSPYTEGVTWIIFNNTVPISDKQIDAFRQLSARKKGDIFVPLGDNYRQLQDIGKRKIYARYARKLDLNKRYPNNLRNFTNFSWFWS